MAWTAGKSSTVEWGTPPELFKELSAALGPFNLDPCSTHENALTRRHFTIEDDGLAQSWAGVRVFMNPPYGREIAGWMRKARREADNGALLVVCLVPCRPDTIWWRDTCCRSEVWLKHGRVKFVGGYTQGPFPVAVVIMRPGDPPYDPSSGWWRVRRILS